MIPNMARLFVEQRRGFGERSVREAIHSVDAVICDVQGHHELLAGSDAITTLRSAGKPFQLEVCLSLLPPELRAALSTHELALGTASHHGEPSHLVGLRTLLARLEVREDELLCGAHPPSHEASARALYARGEQPTPLYNNCAGKHAFMVSACRAQGDPLEYRPEAHPLQQSILARIGERASHPVGLAVIDGCGVPCPALPLSAMARAYASLARELRISSTEGLGRIGAAMRAQPALVSGSEGFDGWLMQHSPLVAKVGALGLLCIADPARDIGIAIKITSGSELARPLAAMAILERALPGVVRHPLPAHKRSVRNVIGAEVGELVTRFEAD
jgi:L-asparaginase II